MAHSSITARLSLSLAFVIAAAISALPYSGPAVGDDASPSDSLARSEQKVGPMVGAVDQTSACLLFRDGETERIFTLAVYDATDDRRVAQQTVTTTAAHDYVAHFRVAGLTPATPYRYAITAASKDAVDVEVGAGSFHTATADRRGGKVTAVLMSCVDIEPNPMWAEIAKTDPDAICLIGDTPYIDSIDLSVVRSRHRDFLAMPGLSELIGTTPTVGVWDDHDFGRNNGNGRSLAVGKRETRAGFIEYRPHLRYGTQTASLGTPADSSLDQHGGVYHQLDLGMMEIFFLDPRYFSQTEPSPVDASQPTCFGAAQWQWLLTGLSQSKAPFKVLAMGAIWQDKKNTETDDMFTYWYERDALLDHVQKNQISGVVCVGGDIHVSRHLMHRDRVGYDLHDFIVSPGHERVITELNVYHPDLQWSLVAGKQYLTLTADAEGGEPRLIARFCQGDQGINREIELPLSQLTPEKKTGWHNALRGYWSMDDGFLDQSGRRAPLDASSISVAADNASKTPMIAAGRVASAAHFRRDDQTFLSVAHNPLDDNSDAHSIAFWMHPSSLPDHGSNQRHFVIESTAAGEPSDHSAWHISLGLRATDDPQQVNFETYTQTLAAASAPERSPTIISQGGFPTKVHRDRLQSWVHVVWTFDSQSIGIYLDGELAARHRLPQPGPAAEFGGLIIGGHRAGVGRNWDGALDEIAIWSRVLSASEIKQLAGGISIATDH